MDAPSWLDADVVVATATVATLIATVIATTVSLRLTVASLELSRKGLRETRQQREQGLMPVLVIEGHTTRIEFRPNDLAMRWGRSFTERQGFRILNGGPGLALEVEASWGFVDTFDADAVTEEGGDVPSALASGAYHDVILDIDPKQVAAIRSRAGAGEGHIFTIGRVEVTYQDVFYQRGKASSSLVLDVSVDPALLTCGHLHIERPGDNYLRDLRGMQTRNPDHQAQDTGEAAAQPGSH